MQSGSHPLIQHMPQVDYSRRSASALRAIAKATDGVLIQTIQDHCINIRREYPEFFVSQVVKKEQLLAHASLSFFNEQEPVVSAKAETMTTLPQSVPEKSPTKGKKKHVLKVIADKFTKKKPKQLTIESLDESIPIASYSSSTIVPPKSIVKTKKPSKAISTRKSNYHPASIGLIFDPDLDNFERFAFLQTVINTKITKLTCNDWTLITWLLLTQSERFRSDVYPDQMCPDEWINLWIDKTILEMPNLSSLEFLLAINTMAELNRINHGLISDRLDIWLNNWVLHSPKCFKDYNAFQMQNIRAQFTSLRFSKAFYTNFKPKTAYWCHEWALRYSELSKELEEEGGQEEYVRYMLLMITPNTEFIERKWPHVVQEIQGQAEQAAKLYPNHAGFLTHLSPKLPVQYNKERLTPVISIPLEEANKEEKGSTYQSLSFWQSLTGSLKSIIFSPSQDEQEGERCEEECKPKGKLSL